MKLTGHDLKQIDNDTLDRLSSERLLSFTKVLLEDFKEAIDRLNQNSNNSSRPPSSMVPWASNKSQDQEDNSHGDVNEHPDENDNTTSNEASSDSGEENPDFSVDDKQSAENASTAATTPRPTEPPLVKRSVGKQNGAQGYGRTQHLPVTETVYNAAIHCTICNDNLGEHVSQTAWTAFYSIDIAENAQDKPGILLTNTKHIFFEVICACGHHNRVEPCSAMADINWPKTSLSEWRLVGPRLAAMITLLSKRFRFSRVKISEFLWVFLGLELSTGTICQTIRESGRSVAPLEEELIRDIEEAALAYVDETSWKEAGALCWLWVFRTLTVVFFMVGKRDRTIFAKLLLSGRFKGIVMSDGWIVYREYANRLRCWAHLARKIKGITESSNFLAAMIGMEIEDLFNALQQAIYEARQAEIPVVGLEIQYAAEIEKLRQLCLLHQDNQHEKLKAFAREMLCDWATIIRQVREPLLPLTNNEAERILRHWVIDRLLSHGTRTPEGTRSFTLLASVIETCRIRGAPVWDFLTSVITAARKGLALPALPIMQA